MRLKIQATHSSFECDATSWTTLQSQCLEQAGDLPTSYRLDKKDLRPSEHVFEDTFHENDTVHIAFELRAEPSSSHRFAVNGDIKMDSNEFFVLDMSDDLHETLIPQITKPGGFLLYHAPRSAGKSTRVKMCMKLLKQKFFVIHMTLQLMCFDDVNSFWVDFVKKLVSLIPDLHENHSFTNRSDVQSIFDKRATWFNEQRVVLFIDELDFLYEVPEIKDSFLNLFRGLKQMREELSLHAVVGIGPFNILKLTTEKTSPFNITDQTLCQNVTYAQMRILFQQWEREREFRLPTDISLDVFQRTKGHLGLICLCGSQLDALLIKNRRHLDYDMWMKFVAHELTRHLLGWATVDRFISCLQRNKDAQQLLLRQFFRQEWVTTSDDDLSVLTTLTAEGILTRHQDEICKYRFSSLLARDIVLAEIARLNRQHSNIIEPVPYLDQDGTLDIRSLILTALKHFSRSDIINAYRNAFKKCINKDIFPSETKVPQEDAYHVELYTVLKRWLPREIRVISQCNPSEDGRSRCDIVIFSSEYTYVLKLLSNATAPEMKEHVSRTARYAKALEATEAWTIHFVSTLTPASNALFMWPEEGNGVRSLYSLHDREFNKGQVVSQSATEDVDFPATE
eukprot:GILJ01007276.1.p1 GENE.GILJ01007276.1~~GILJ01007276.1.p1  ORF type:complete len:623 (+),score=62.08 GILJ01007276.1:478-2346(+)